MLLRLFRGAQHGAKAHVWWVGDRGLREATVDKLDALLAKYEKRLKAIRETRERDREEREAFVAGFDKLCEEVIRPVMDEIGQKLRERGHDYVLTEQDWVSPEGRRQSKRISLLVFPAGERRPEAIDEDTPILNFAANRTRRVVHIYGTSPFVYKDIESKTPSELALGEMSRDTVEERVLDLLGEVFGRER
jgi:hypothetical protein